jgi:hypothetical protein
MPLPHELLEEIGARRRAEQVEADRVRRRALTRAAAACVGWLVIGLYLLGWSMHTTDLRYAGAAFVGGLTLGNGGIIFTLLRAYRQGEERGDW